jgi:hypothetical protein
MYKTILLIASLSLISISCQKNAEQKSGEKTENKVADSTDENAGYEINADVTSTENYEMLIPDGYDLLAKEEGDINNDGTSDMVMVVKSQQEKVDEMPADDVPGRILILLTKDAKGMYSRAGENTSAILAKNEGGAASDDPFEGITISPGKFSITHMGGAAERWSEEDVFTYDKAANAWFLTEKNTGTFSTMNPEDESMKKETPKDFGKINFVDFKP